MRSFKISPGQTLRYLELPASLPVFLGGLRVGATLSVIGAIVGELVGSDRGLGFLINVGRGQYDTALVFVAVLTLMMLAASLYGLILLLESRLLAWQTLAAKRLDMESLFMKRLTLIFILAALLLTACAGGKPTDNADLRAVTLNLTYIPTCSLLRFMPPLKTATLPTRG